MNIRTLLIASSLIAASLVSGAAQAALQGRDLNGSVGSFEAYYDTDLNITWLANANMNGAMVWTAANTWAANLSFTDGVNVYDNWRLPTSDTCSGYSCTGSEMGYLFYTELGGSMYQSILTSTTDPDLAKFINLQADYYWSGAEYVPNADNAWNTNNAWNFGFGNGFQSAGIKGTGFYALAVSPGDVAAVPEAQTYALMLAGLGLIGWRVRRRG